MAVSVVIIGLIVIVGEVAVAEFTVLTVVNGVVEVTGVTRNRWGLVSLIA